MARRSGLGRGLGALIPGEVMSEASTLRSLAVSSIRPNPRQPRATFDEEALASLTASIQAVGVLQPILVRQTGEDEYELIAGERRWRASRRAGLQSIPALVQSATDASSLEQAVVENLHREDLNPMEEAAAYQQLIEDFGMTHEDLAARVGRSRAAVTNMLRLFQLPPNVQRMVSERQLDAGHARALLSTPDRAFQEALARRAVAENMSVRAVEEAVRARNGQAAPPGRPRNASRPSTPKPAGLAELESLLSAYLDTRVTVDVGSGKGRLVVEFATLEDLERIYRLMTSGQRATASQPGDAR